MATDPVTAAFAVNLIRLRTGQNLTRRALGDLAGVDPTVLGRIEAGLGGTNLAAAARLAAALSADLQQMITPATPEGNRS